MSKQVDLLPSVEENHTGPNGTTLTAAINESQRILNWYKRAYPKAVKDGRLDPLAAHWRIDVLEDIVFLLEDTKRRQKL